MITLTSVEHSITEVKAELFSSPVSNHVVKLSFGASFALMTEAEARQNYERNIGRVNLNMAEAFSEDGGGVAPRCASGTVVFIHGDGMRKHVAAELYGCLLALMLEREQRAYANGTRREGAPA